MPAILSFALQALSMAPQIVSAGLDLATYVSSAVSAVRKMQAENRDPTPEEWAALDGDAADVHAKIQAL